MQVVYLILQAMIGSSELEAIAGVNTANDALRRALIGQICCAAHQLSSLTGCVACCDTGSNYSVPASSANYVNLSLTPAHFLYGICSYVCPSLSAVHTTDTAHGV